MKTITLQRQLHIKSTWNLKMKRLPIHLVLKKFVETPPTTKSIMEGKVQEPISRPGQKALNYKDLLMEQQHME